MWYKWSDPDSGLIPVLQVSTQSDIGDPALIPDSF